MKAALSLVTLLSLSPAALAASFNLVKAYQGTDFFSGWEFYGTFDNTTNGDVNFVPQSNSSSLAYVDGNGRAIIRVDNTSFVPYNEKRNSVKITSTDAYEPGTIWVFDATHLPYGCSVWPAFWTKGLDWPRQGEIDIVEGVNKQTANQMALHTFNGCNAQQGAQMKGTLGNTNCNSTDGAGCTVGETTPNSYGEGFANAGGGVWATQFDTSGIFIWFWNRANVPSDISSGGNSVDPSGWGTPSAAYPSSACDINQFFGAQQLVLDITLCGDWAGVPSIYQPQCGGDGSAQGCYVNSVINDGSTNFAQAYFEINYIKAFGANSSVIASGAGSSGASATNSAGGSSPTSGSGSGSGSGNSDSSDANSMRNAAWGVVGASLLALLAVVSL
ncbi:hypothetical protein K474DRAFT_1609105 [Panus rudis PR-1116 ss-1]|nr:hypothetical protein K474DRAFT_1609105 [Panus rudis PR-1116 ss-1]